MRRHCQFLAAMLALAAPLAGCGGDPDRDLAARVIVDGPATRPDIERLPLRPADAALRAITAQGLVSFDAEGRVQPALARRWIVTDDGRSIIFRVDGSRWSDGSRVDAAQVRRLLTARIGALRQAGWRRDLSGISGIEAMTGNVVELRLSHPRPHLLQLLAQPELGVLRSAGGTGPLVAAPGAPAGSYVTLAARFPPEGEEPPADPLRLTLGTSSAAAALVDFGAGRVDVVLGGQYQHLPLLGASGVDGNAVRTDPVAGLFGLLVVRPTGPLAEPELREALAMAIDRPALLASFNLGQWQEAVTIVPEALPGWRTGNRPQWTYADLETRRITARARLAEWAAANGPPPRLRVALPPGPGSRILFARLAADWRRIGVEATMTEAGAAADLRLVDRVADYDSAIWYLARLGCGTAPLCSEDADQLLDAALAGDEAAAQTDALVEAELTLLRFQNYIPLANPVRWWLVRPGRPGLTPNPRGLHNLSVVLDAPTSRR